MRYLTLALAALLFAPSILAQTYAIDKGSYLLGGGIAFSSLGGDGEERRSILAINPGFSYFVVPGLSLGVNTSFSRSSGEGYSFTSFGFGPRVAYYFGDAEARVYPYAASSLDYVRTETVGTRAPSTVGFVGDVSAGLAVMIARNVALNSEAFFQTTGVPTDVLSNRSGNVFGIRGGVTAFVF